MKIDHDAYKYIFDYGKRPTGTEVSIHFEDTFRIDKAKEQAKLTPARIEDIIKYTNEFLIILGMKSIADPVLHYPNAKLAHPDFYNQIMKDNNLKDIRDIVWMKFTKDGFLGVVAVSNDINFDIPSFYHQYNYELKGQHNWWIYNTSGIIIHMLGKVWDEQFVLVFPLSDIPECIKQGDTEHRIGRGHVECGIGNYLIEKKVPILDFFSHRF